MILQGLFSLLSSTGGLTALVANRIFPLQLPEDSTLPALTYRLISTKSSPTMDTSGLQRWRIQFDCWGKDYADAVSVRDAVRHALEGYRGTLTDGTYLQDAQLNQMLDSFEHESLHWRAIAEFYLFFGFSS